MNKLLYYAVFVLMFAAAAFAQESSCPVTFVKVNPETKQSWTRAKKGMLGLGGKPEDLHHMSETPDFEIQIKNGTEKDIRGMKINAGYFDATEDVHPIPVTWNWSKTLKAGQETTMSWPNELYQRKNQIGWVVVPLKILFEDGTKWELTENSPCMGEYWRDKKHPRLTKFPQELLKNDEKKAQ